MLTWLKTVIAAARWLRLNELWRDYPYIQLCNCGNPAYQRNGKTYKLCAECGLRFLQAMLNYPSIEPNVTAQQAVNEALDYIPYQEWNK